MRLFGRGLVVSLVLCAWACGDDAGGSGGGGTGQGSTGSGASGQGSTTSSSTASSGTGGEGGATSCVPGETRACYGGLSGTEGQGTCVPGVETCNATGDGYGPCEGEVLPQVEDCATPADESCDGVDCGQTLWARWLGVGTYGIAGAALDVVDWQGRIAVGAALMNAADPMELSGVGIVELDVSGMTSQVRTFASALGTVTAIELAAGEDGTLAFGAVAANDLDLGGGPLDGLVVAKLDAGGQHLWSKAFPAGNFGADQLTAMTQTVEGDVVVAGFAAAGLDLGDGPLPQGGFVARFASADGALVASAALGFTSQRVRVVALDDGRFVVAASPKLSILDADLTESCAAAVTINASGLDRAPDGTVWVAHAVFGGIDAFSVAPDCSTTPPFTIVVAQPLNPALAVAKNGDLFVSWSPGGASQTISRRGPGGAEIWTRVYPATNVVDQEVVLLDGIWPIASSLAITGGIGAGIDYGTGPLDPGVAIGRVAP